MSIVQAQKGHVINNKFGQYPHEYIYSEYSTNDENRQFGKKVANRSNNGYVYTLPIDRLLYTDSLKHRT